MYSELETVLYIFLALGGVLVFSILAWLAFGFMENARHDEACQKIRDEDEWDRKHHQRILDTCEQTRLKENQND